MTDRLIAGRYQIEDRLGSGGMSTVYRATDTLLERSVALKMLAEHLSDDEKFITRFKREALAVAKLIHPNIVQVYDTGIDAHHHYIVMEYVEGRSCAQLLRARGLLDPEVAREIAVQSCEGLEYAHRKGVIHRDVKPGNLMVLGGPAADDGQGTEMTVKLADFGIARATEHSRITQVGSVVGTAAYLAPEQARGGEATPASDVYALGVVLYQLLTGRLPFEGSSLAEIAVRHQNEDPLPPAAYEDTVPEDLSDAVLGALETDPADRYTSARELQRALTGDAEPRRPGAPRTYAPPGAATASTRVLSEPGAPGADPSQTWGWTGETTAQPAARSRPRRALRRFAILLLLLLLAAAAATIVVLVTTDTGPEVRQVVEDTVTDQVRELRELIGENTAPR